MAIFLGIVFLTFIATATCRTSSANTSLTLREPILASSLYSVEKNKTSASFLLSPLSLQTAGAILFTGADGQTAKEIEHGFQLSKTEEEIKTTLEKYTKNPYVQIANRIYFAKGIHIRSAFQQTVSQDYLSRAENVDFSRINKVVRKVNNWIRNITSDKIHDVVDSATLKQDTRLLLVNAIHFKGKWKYPFEKLMTTNAAFWINKSEQKDVRMMRVIHEFKYKRCTELHASVLEMDYENSDISLMIILPKSRIGLAHVEENLTTVDLLKLSHTLRYRHVIVRIPQFRIEYSTDLYDAFLQMGMSTMFSNQADFKRMVLNESLKVDKVVHKSFIEVNEDGTEAAAVTTIAMSPIMLRPRKRFEANRPFFFAIKSKTEILFVGRYKG